MLYLCPRISVPAFKAGTTKPVELKRLKDLQTKYDGDFDFAESYLVKAKDDRATIDLEWQLKRDLKEYRYEIEGEKIEGFSEFYDIKALPMILNYIEVKAKAFEHLGLTIEKGIRFKTPWRQRKPICRQSQKCKYLDSERPHHFYDTIKSILEYKDAFTYYEEKREDAANNEGTVGVLVSLDTNFLHDAYSKNSKHYFSREYADNGRVQDAFLHIIHPSPYFIDTWEIEGNEFTYGALATCVVIKSPSMEEYSRKDFKEKENIIASARMACFQRICRRELAPTPYHLRVGLEVESGK